MYKHPPAERGPKLVAHVVMIYGPDGSTQPITHVVSSAEIVDEILVRYARENWDKYFSEPLTPDESPNQIICAFFVRTGCRFHRGDAVFDTTNAARHIDRSVSAVPRTSTVADSVPRTSVDISRTVPKTSGARWG